MEHAPREPGSEEYLDSEKYQLRHWDSIAPDSLAPLIARLNRIRAREPGAAVDRGLRFHPTDNDALIVLHQATDDGENVVLVVVNLDPHHRSPAGSTLDLDALGSGCRRALPGARPADRRALPLAAARATSCASIRRAPAHVFRVRRRVRTERDFDYFL